MTSLWSKQSFSNTPIMATSFEKTETNIWKESEAMANDLQDIFHSVL